MRKTVLLASLLALGATKFSIAAETNNNTVFTPAQKAAIGEEVKTYLLENPEILIKMSEALQSKEAAKQQAKADAAVPANADALFNAKTSPIAGNPKGKITIVEFFDYQCGHCRTAADDLNALVERNKDIRIIYKAFPIFGDMSQLASKVAMAANQQGKFQATHDALMDIIPPFTKEKIMGAAKEAGVNMKKLKKALADTSFDAEFKQNYTLASAMGIVGTPTFIISTPDYPATTENQTGKVLVFIPGAVNLTLLEAAVKKVSAHSLEKSQP